MTDADAVARMREWFDAYLSQPHELLGRPGHVCPFVEPARQAGTLRVEVRRVRGDTSAEELRGLAAEMEELFDRTQWAHANRTLRALVFVLPDLPEESWTDLDGLQAALKPGLATRGLMFGQFHPRCPERSARNPAFEVSRSPLPMLAMRNMSVHDILFLDEEPVEFAAYAARFGSRCARPGAVDTALASRFAAARLRFSPSPGGTEDAP